MLTPSLDIFRHQPYRHYWIMRQSLSAARQMQAVAIGWQVYDVARETRSIEESALMLGFVGLAQFAPVFFLSLVGGQAADRLDRKLILVVTNLVRVACALVLAISPFYANEMTLWLVFGAAILLGVMHAFSPAAASALLPRIVPREDMRQAIAWNSLGFQGAAIGGPALGGLLYILGPSTVYLVSARPAPPCHPGHRHRENAVARKDHRPVRLEDDAAGLALCARQQDRAGRHFAGSGRRPVRAA